MPEKITTVDDYIAQIPPEMQPAIQRLRAAIRAAAPQAEERISYTMPCYYQNGFVVSFAVWKKHIALYPTPSERDFPAGELEPFRAKNAKASLHFPLDQPLPLDLIARIVRSRLAENQK